MGRESVVARSLDRKRSGVRWDVKESDTAMYCISRQRDPSQDTLEEDESS